MEVTTIYHQFHTDLFKYIRSKVRSTEDAEDILQNVFIKIASGIDGLSEEAKVKNWIFTITKNTIVDYYRTKRDVTAVDRISVDVPEPDDMDATKGLDQCMSRMIGLLPYEYRDIIIESEINGVRQKELANRYGMPYPSMRSKVQRGRERLKQLFYNCCHISTDVRGNVMEVHGKGSCGGSCSPCS